MPVILFRSTCKRDACTVYVRAVFPFGSSIVLVVCLCLLKLNAPYPHALVVRGNNATAPVDPRLDVTRRIRQRVAKKRPLEQELFVEYAEVLGMKPDADLARKLMQAWDEVRVCLLACTRSHELTGGPCSICWCILGVLAFQVQVGSVIDLEITIVPDICASLLRVLFLKFSF